MTRRERPLWRHARRRTTKTQRRITQDGIQHLKFMAMSSRDNAVASACPSPRAAHWFDRSLNRDIDLTRVCMVCELLI